MSFADTQEAPEQDDSAAPSSKAPAVPEQETPIQLEQAEAHAKADRILAKDMGVSKKAVTCKSLHKLPAALDGPPVPARYYFPEDIEVWVSDKLLEPDDATVPGQDCDQGFQDRGDFLRGPSLAPNGGACPQERSEVLPGG